MKNGGAGKVWYGMHMYPGVAEYREPDAEPFRIYVNDVTIREMGPSFAGRPVFVHHVEGVESNIDQLRKEAQGWVVESFFNEADGKHWVKFMTVSEKADDAIKRGFRLSNAYLPTAYGAGGMWNGLDYDKQMQAGEYDHLAIVPNPRYEESVILSPEQFKKYNEDKTLELKRLANTKDDPMKLSFWKKAKVENATNMDLSDVSVTLPKSGREVALLKLCNDADDMAMKEKEPQMANMDHHVEYNGKNMTLNDFMTEHKRICDELDGMKKNMSGDDSNDEGVENDDTTDEGGDKSSLQLTEEKEKQIAEAKKKNALDEKAAAKKAEGAVKAKKLANADKTDQTETYTVQTLVNQVERGKSRYG